MKHPYIFGDSAHPERVIAALEAKGGKNSNVRNGYDEGLIYYIDAVSNYIDICDKDSTMGQLITTHPDWERTYPEPDYKFEVGDKVQVSGTIVRTVKELCNDKGNPAYILDDFGFAPESKLTRYTEPKPECTFKPFDRVLVRNSDENRWIAGIFSHYEFDEDEPYICVGALWKQCIPYEGNEALLGTTDSPSTTQNN